MGNINEPLLSTAQPDGHIPLVEHRVGIYDGERINCQEK